MSTYYAHYQQATLGQALGDSLDELVTRAEIPPHVAKAIMGHYDRAVVRAFGAVKTKATFKGKMKTFKLVDNVWSFYLREVQLKIDATTLQINGGQITACDSKNAATS